MLLLEKVYTAYDLLDFRLSRNCVHHGSLIAVKPKNYRANNFASLVMCADLLDWLIGILHVQQKAKQNWNSISFYRENN